MGTTPVAMAPAITLSGFSPGTLPYAPPAGLPASDRARGRGPTSKGDGVLPQSAAQGSSDVDMMMASSASRASSAWIREAVAGATPDTVSVGDGGAEKEREGRGSDIPGKSGTLGEEGGVWKKSKCDPETEGGGGGGTEG